MQQKQGLKVDMKQTIEHVRELSEIERKQMTADQFETHNRSQVFESIMKRTDLGE